MPYQLSFPEITEFESDLIMEKRARVALATADGLKDRADDRPVSTYLKNPAVRVIEWVKNASHEWIRRERVTHEFPSRPTELVEFDDLRQVNRDLLPVEAFVDQGTQQPKEPRFPSDRSLQNECIIGENGQLLAFHLKVDEYVPLHHQLDWIKENFGSEPGRYREAFIALDFDFKTVVKLISTQLTLGDLEFFASEIPTNKLKSERQKQDEAAVLDFRSFDVSEYSRDSAFPDKFASVLESIEHEFEPEEEEPSASCFGLHPLHYEEDGCSHEFLNFLRFASIKEIKGIMKGFFPQKNEWGTVCKPRFWYLTASQKAQAWQYINARRTRLGIFSSKINFTKAKGESS